MYNLQALDGLQVLAVDDNTDSLELIQFILEMHNAQVTPVTCASQALQVITQVKPDILISDISMPLQDGYWLIRQVRNLTQELGNIPAIALTGHASDQERNLALQAGFSTHISKPLDPDVLLATVATFASNLQSKTASQQYRFYTKSAA
ncbi:hypothetical protein CAL7716_102830 (plasmid) [Calothrix sp. PCC 7716]|nr:hypothetical protein CAL7716_102830 [Calothrix sp. PCC 7716]